MAGHIAVITDSTSYLPDGLADRYGVTVVPLTVTLGGESGREGVDVTPADVARELAERRGRVTTSRPSPAVLGAAYRDALDAGAAGVVSVHLSRRLSGTWDSARRAADLVGGAGLVRVVDSRSTAMGLGFCVLAAARAAGFGAGLAEVARAAVRTASRTSTLFYVDTLEHLRRGGRIATATALLGTALSVKPILHVADGQIVPLEKVRTISRALARLEALAVAEAGDDEVDVAVQHLAAPERAVILADRLRDRIPKLADALRSEVGAVVGAHGGPGLLGVVVSRR